MRGENEQNTKKSVLEQRDKTHLRYKLKLTLPLHRTNYYPISLQYIALSYNF